MSDKTIAALRGSVESCKKCELAQSRTNAVFGEGNPKAAVMFVGEAPGENEDLRGRPFVGRSGMLLDQMLAEVGLYRDKNIYITNMIKCRPPQNRDPKPEEVELCLDYLRDQVRIIRPKIIVCVGRIAAMSLIEKNYKVTKQHGEFIKRAGVYMTGMFHPAALLRNPTQKPAAAEDFLRLKELIQNVCPETYA